MLETFAIATTNATNSVLPTTSTAMSGLVPFAGSMLAGYCIGFALKKVVKWLLIGLGILAGLIFLAVQWMANNGYIQGVRWDKLGSSYGQHLATQIDFNNLHGVFHYLGIPMTSGLAIGAMVGFLRTR